MASRQRGHRRYDDRRGYGLEGPPLHGDFHRSQHSVFLEDELEVLNVELRRLFEDNRRLDEDRIALRRELSAAKDEVHHLNGVFVNIQADQETQLRELYEKGKKLESDVRATEPLKNEVAQLRDEVQKLSSSKIDNGRQIKTLTAEREKLHSENKQIHQIRSEVDELKQEFMRVSMALDYEKKASFELMEQRQGMEKNMISMSQEAEKLRADLGISDRRTWAAGGHYGMTFESGDAGFPRHYNIGYGGHADATDKSSVYGSESTSWGGLEKRRR